MACTYGGSYRFKNSNMMNGLNRERCSKTTRAPPDDISAIIVYYFFLWYPRDRFIIDVFNGSFAPPTVYLIPRCGPRPQYARCTIYIRI